MMNPTVRILGSCLVCFASFSILRAGDGRGKSQLADITLAQLAGTWTGTSSFSMGGTNKFEVILDANGNVTGGSWVGHPFQKKGSTTLKPGNQNDLLSISVYFSDVCQGIAKTVSGAKVYSNAGTLEMDADVTNSCYPDSNGTVHLTKPDSGSTAPSGAGSQTQSIKADGLVGIPQGGAPPAPASDAGGCLLRRD